MGNSEAKVAAEARFRTRLAELGVILVEPYRGRHHPHQARCVAGHECSPRPGDVLRGSNPCGACAGRSAAWSEAKFRARVAALGGQVLEPSWLGTHVPHRVKCAAGHVTTPLPGNVIAGHGVCTTCAGNDPIAAEAAFRARLAELGATLLEPYQASGSPHRAQCAAGHECFPRPGDVKRGIGICRTCAGQDPAVAKAAFCARLAELGATLLEPYHGSGEPHRVRCAAGHECWPRPGGVRSGQGICLTCAGNDPAVAGAAFRARVAELGGEVLGAYRGGHIPVRVRCAAGHECAPHPSSVMSGRGMCRTCAGQDPAVAGAAFCARLAELGATLLEPYQGNHHSHRVQCAVGHMCTPSPSSVRRGNGICRTCTGTDPAVAEARFRARLAALRATLLEPYQGALYPHKVRCAAGHLCAPRPNSVQQGGGICRACAGMVWDVFYVAANRPAARIKFGITSGDPRPRLATHRRSGYEEILRLMTGLPGIVAPQVESAARAALALAGMIPVAGREYYDISALAIVLDVADNWPLSVGVKLVTQRSHPQEPT